MKSWKSRISIFLIVAFLISIGILSIQDAEAAPVNWGRDVQNPTSTTADHSLAMGGTSPNVDNMEIKSISIYLGAQTGDVRLAVYTGGALDNPSAATLLWDAGTVNPNGNAGWYTINHPSGGVSWPKNTVTWLAWKRNTGVAVYYSSSSADAGNFQTAQGSNNNSFSHDPTVAFPNPYGQTGIFSNDWYSIYVSYDIATPVANFTANPLTGAAPLLVTFTDQSTGVVTSWSWNFGDGGSSTEQNPTYTYTQNGTFTVSLTVTGPGGSNTLQKIGYVNISDELPQIIIDHSPTNVSQPRLAADGNGHVYAVWEDIRNGSSDIYFNYSSDYGKTWQTADIRLDTDTVSGNSVTPQIACDNSGHVYVVWRDTRSGNPDVYFNYSTDYGVTWQGSDKKLGTINYNPNPQFPKIACDNNGHVYVAWNDNYFNASSDFGATWFIQPVHISTAGGEETQLTCDQNNRVYVAWRLGTTNVLFNYSINAGNTWQSTDLVISDSGAIPSGGLSLASDNSGHIYCTWHDARNNVNNPDVYFNSSSNYGNTWGASDTILNTGTPGSTYSIYPEVACDNSGNVYVAWYDRRNNLGDIYLNFSSDYGVSWQTSDIRLDTDSPGTVDSGYPEIATNNSGHVFVIWNDVQTDIGSGLYMNYSLNYGNTWLSTNMKIGSSGFQPQIVTHDSRSYVVIDNSDIVFTGLAPLLAIDPFPSDGATQVSLTPTLSWRGGNLNLDDTLTYDVYFGTSSPPQTLVSFDQPGRTYVTGTLSYFTTYYWQIVSRDNPGTETPGPIWSFTTLSNPPQLSDFSPPDSAINVETAPTLSWSATDPDIGDTITYDVYFGSTNPPTLKATNQMSNTYSPGLLYSNKTYYWKIVARDNHGSETVGPIISFTTLNNPPQFALFSPDDGETGVTFTPTLSWSASDPDIGDTLVYDIYFGTSNPPPLVISDKVGPTYKPGQVTPLIHMTVYYWKIVVRDNHGAQTESPVISFTTLDNPPVLSNYSPAHMSGEVSITPTLSWSATDPNPDDTITYDVYFGTISPPPLVVSNHTVTNYQPGEIAYSIKHYWKIVARDHHGVETVGSILSFYTFSRPPEFQGFTPANLSTDISKNPTLSWSASDPDPEDTMVYDVYFGFSPNPLLVATNKTSATYKPGELYSLVKYYWKVVARDNHGKETIGPILSFITTSSPPQLTNFSPVDLSTEVSITPTLSWWAYDEDAGDTVICDVYFGTSSDPPLVVSISSQSNQTYQPGELLPLTTYYWKIVAHDNHGDERVSAIRSFTTANKLIDSISPNPCKTRRILSIMGRFFGDSQGTSEIHWGAKVFGPGSPRIIMWSNTRIDLKIPVFSTWPSGTIKTKNLWVRINDVDSNKVKLTVRKP